MQLWCDRRSLFGKDALSTDRLSNNHEHFVAFSGQPNSSFQEKTLVEVDRILLFSRRACEYSSVDSLALILEERVTPADINTFAAVVLSYNPE